MARELVYTGFMSLDGVVDSPGGTAEGHRSGGWVTDTEFVAEAFALKGDELDDTTALMFGRHSYEVFAPVWRDSEDTRRTRFPEVRLVDDLHDADLFDGWVDQDPAIRDDVASVKQRRRRRIFIHGSAELPRRLSEADLISRSSRVGFPVLLGAGKRIISRDDRDKRQLRLRESASYSNGVTKLLYDVAY